MTEPKELKKPEKKICKFCKGTRKAMTILQDEIDCPRCHLVFQWNECIIDYEAYHVQEMEKKEKENEELKRGSMFRRIEMQRRIIEEQDEQIRKLKESLPSEKELGAIIMEFIPHKDFMFIVDLAKAIHKRIKEGV